MLAKNSDVIKNAASTIYQLSEEEAIRLQCEARERYEHDTVSVLNLGLRQGRMEGKAIATEQINKLAKLLHADGRIEDFIRSTTDSDFQQALLKEYQLLETKE